MRTTALLSPADELRDRIRAYDLTLRQVRDALPARDRAEVNLALAALERADRLLQFGYVVGASRARAAIQAAEAAQANADLGPAWQPPQP